MANATFKKQLTWELYISTKLCTHYEQNHPKGQVAVVEEEEEEKEEEEEEEEEEEQGENSHCLCPPNSDLTL